MPTTPRLVLLSWIARKNDPYKRDDQDRFVLDAQGARIPGPTLSLLFDKDSPFAGSVADVVLLARIGKDREQQEHEKRVVEEIKQAIRERDPKILADLKYWDGDSPIDHRGIFAFSAKHLHSWCTLNVCETPTKRSSGQ